MMKRHLPLHAASLAALACCGLHNAAAQTPTTASAVQLYGLLAPMVDRVSVTGASSTAPANAPTMLATSAYNGAGNQAVTRMQSATSNFGMRGTEDLGGGLTALFQLESGMQVDDGTLTGGAPSATRFFNRNSRVGLSDARWGTLFAGIWDTPSAWSHLGLTNGVRNPYSGDSSAVFVTPGFNVPHSVTVDGRTNGAGDATFNRRQGNAVQYWSPNWSGLSFRLAYALPEGEKTAANGAKYAPTVRGLGAEYAAGPLLLRYAYQQQDDYFGLAWIGPNRAANPDVAGSTAHSSRDTNHRLIARYAVTPTLTVQGTFDRVAYQADGVAAGGMDSYRRNAYAALVIYRSAAHAAWANLGLAQDGQCGLAGSGNCRTDALGARMWSMGYRYDFSRRTDVFASVYRVSNRANGQYGVFPRPVAGIAPGSRQTALTLGIEHSF